MKEFRLANPDADGSIAVRHPAEHDAVWAYRLITLASTYDDANCMQATVTGGVTLQIVRD